MKILVTTANLGNFDKRIENVEQTVEHDFYRFTDENFPPRACSMTPRLQARIAKTHGWQIKPDYDFYVWIDSSCIFGLPTTLEWLLDKCKDKDFVVFRHPQRKSIESEANYLKGRLEKGCQYITPRYENELIDEQLKVIKGHSGYVDDRLYASTVMMYRNTKKARGALTNWWYHISRFHSIDQLSLPYVLWDASCDIHIIPDSYTNTPYLTYVRNNKDF